jgi:hypothetical protein
MKKKPFVVYPCIACTGDVPLYDLCEVVICPHCDNVKLHIEVVCEPYEDDEAGEDE